MAMLGYGFTLNPSNKSTKKGSKADMKMAEIMGEYKSGKLKGGIDPKGPKKAPIVKNRKQAVAIALAISGAGKKMKKGMMKKGMKKDMK